MIDKTLNKKQGIYLLKIEDKTYVGSSVNLYNRIHFHYYQLKLNKHHSIYLQRVVNKYGIENLKYEILEINDLCIEELRKREEYYMNLHTSEFNTRNPFTYVLPKEKCNQIRDTLIRKYLNKEIVIWNKGKGRKYNIYDFSGNQLQTNIDTEEIVSIYKVSNRSVINFSLRKSRYWFSEFEIIVIPIDENYEDFINKCIVDKNFLSIPIFSKDSDGNIVKCPIITKTRLLKKIIDSENYIYYSKNTKKYYSFVGKFKQ